MKNLAKNKKAYFDYEIEKEIEAGIMLYGDEVKSLKEYSCSLKEAHVYIDNNEVFISNLSIKPYSGNRNHITNNYDSTRKRKLLLHKKEIIKLKEDLTQKGYSCVPLNMYINDRGLVKINIGLGKGKKLHDKREAEKKKEQRRSIQYYVA